MNRQTLVTLLAGVAMLLVAAQSCGNDNSCVTSGDCFQGELCIDGSCAVDPTNNSDTGSNNDVSNNDVSNNDVSNNDTSNNDTGTAGACTVDPIGNQCEDDGFEPNDQDLGIPDSIWDSQSWCDGTELVPTQTSEPLALCAGNLLDVYRLNINNVPPNNCVTQQFTWTIEVAFEEACETGLVEIRPYYNGPFQDTLCADDEDFRCRWSDDRKTYTIEFVRQPAQTMDMNLAVFPADQQNNTVQVDYTVTMSITQ